MQSVSPRIWTRVAVSISYDDNNYTVDTSFAFIVITFSSKLYQAQVNELCFVIQYSIHLFRW